MQLSVSDVIKKEIPLMIQSIFGRNQQPLNEYTAAFVNNSLKCPLQGRRYYLMLDFQFKITHLSRKVS